MGRPPGSARSGERTNRSTQPRAAAPFAERPRPPRTFVRRPRLQAALDEAVTRAVTALVAPAGSGKTATLAAWAAGVDQDVLWLAVRSTEPGTGLAQALLAAAGATDGPVPARMRPEAVAEALRQSDGDPAVLVVDDAHRLGPAAWQLLDTVLTLAPDRVRLVLATRRDVPMPLVALELAQELTVLRGDAFRFDDDEARHLVAAHSPQVPADDVQPLLDRAGGWAAALVLGARRLRGGAAGDAEAARRALAHTDQPVLDYLLGDVFSTLPAGTRHVLLCTAGEEEVSPESAVLLSADPDAAANLAGLAADGLLVTGYDRGPTTVWHYHPLLQELLRRQVALDGPDHELALAAHLRAAEHYAEHGPAGLALRHAVASGDGALVTQVLLERGVTLLVSGQEAVVHDAVAALTDATADTPAAVHGVNGLLLRCRGELDEAVRRATLAAQAARTVRAELAAQSRAPSPTELGLLADSATLDAWLARFGWHDADDAIATARRLLGERPDRVAGGATARPLEPARTAWLLHELAIVETWAGRLGDAARHADEALLIAQTVELPRLSAAALADRAVLELLHGAFQTSAVSGRDCLAAAAEADRLEDGYLNRPHVAIGWAAFYELRLDNAADALSRLRGGDQAGTDPLVAMLALVLAARLEAERGDVTGARKMLAHLPPHPEPQPPFLRGILAVVRAYWAMVAKDLAEVQQQLPVMDELDWVVSAGAFRAVISDLAGDAEAARQQLEAVLGVPAEGEQVGCSVFAAAYLAHLHLDAGRLVPARVALREALTRAAPQRLLHPLLTGTAGDARFAALLTELSRGPDAHPFAAAALETARRYRRPYPGLSGTGPAVSPPRLGQQRGPTERVEQQPVPPQSLTGREAEVLAELALGGSYADIAHTLYVTENTVKTHVSALYRKLGVDRRADALRRARQIGLL